MKVKIALEFKECLYTFVTVQKQNCKVVVCLTFLVISHMFLTLTDAVTVVHSGDRGKSSIRSQRRRAVLLSSHSCG